MTEQARPLLAEQLDLSPHPEGGWFREMWRSPVGFTPDGYAGARASATCIYFLLQPHEESQWHRVTSTEIWFWHSGGPLTLSLGGHADTPASTAQQITLGPDVSAGQAPQVIIPAGDWQAARPASDKHVLVSCVVSPGFDFADFELFPASDHRGFAGA
jgi:hypothetical protein